MLSAALCSQGSTMLRAADSSFLILLDGWFSAPAVLCLLCVSFLMAGFPRLRFEFLVFPHSWIWSNFSSFLTAGFVEIFCSPLVPLHYNQDLAI